MAGGIRSATPAVPRVPVQDAIPAAWRTQASPLAILALPMVLGTPLAGRALPRQEAGPIQPEPLVSGVVMVGEAVGVVATVGIVATVGAVVGVGASDGRTGDLAGGTAGILGFTIPIGISPRRHTTIPIMARMMTGPTIRPTGLIRRTTLTYRGATGTCQARPTPMSAVAQPDELITAVSRCLPPAISATTSGGD